MGTDNTHIVIVCHGKHPILSRLLSGPFQTFEGKNIVTFRGIWGLKGIEK